VKKPARLGLPGAPGKRLSQSGWWDFEFSNRIDVDTRIGPIQTWVGTVIILGFVAGAFL
jgi:hypothetical protein